ncbi:hypothetical protein KAR34_11060 [bacterium]|nr:hypothetical protein [bacterium]
MQSIILRSGAGIVIAGLLVIGSTQTGLARKKSEPGKLRSRTGVIAEISQDQMILDLGKKGEVVVQVSKETVIQQEQVSALEEITKNAIVRIKGQGKGNTVAAKAITLLPEKEKFSLLKKAKSGSAYGEQSKNIQLKAQVVQTEPLMVMNRSQQKIMVTLTGKSRGKVTPPLLKKIVVVAPENIEVGMKVRVRYRETEKNNLAKEILIKLVRMKKQTKR